MTIPRAPLALAVLLGLSAGPAAAQQTPNLAPPRSHNVTASPIEVPMISINGLPIVDVMINGQGPFKLGIETGAGFSAITPDTAAALKLARLGGTDENPSYRLDKVAIGAATFERVEVSSTRLAQGGIAGILGLPFYADLLLTLDYPAQRVRFSRGALPATNGSDVLPIAHVGPFWSLPLVVGGATMQAVIDTRSTGGFSFTPDSAKQVKFTGDLAVVGRARGAAIAETEVLGGTIAGEAAIGRYRFPAATATVRSLPPGFPANPIVGARILGNFVVTLDQKQQRIRLARTGGDVILLAQPAPVPPAATSRGGGPALPTADYLGTYGDRVITEAGGVLSLERGGRGKIRMVPAERDAFTLEGIPEARVEFVRVAGKITEIRVRQRDGSWDVARKSR